MAGHSLARAGSPLTKKILQLTLVVAALVLAGCSHPDPPVPTPDPGPTPTPTPTPTPDPTPDPEDPTTDWPAGDPMQNITYLHSKDRVLTTTLVEAPGNVTLNGTTYPTILYNNVLIPPVWRLNEGDRIDVTLVDRRPVDNATDDHSGHGDGAHKNNYTNMHFHGLTVPPQPPQDDVFIELHPYGSNKGNWSYNYSVQLPDDHPQGLFWFHPHPHGVSDGQVLGGMSGAMIIGNVTKTNYPNVNYTKERLFLLRDFSNQIPTKGNGPVGTANKTINGMPWSEFQIAPGETQFWRFGNIGSDLYFNMSLVSADANQTPVPFYLISVDGNVLDQPRTLTNLFVHPGGRMEGFIVGPPEGNYTLKSLPLSRGGSGGPPEPEANLSAVTSTGTVPPGSSSTASQILASTPAKPDLRLDVLRDYVALKPNVTRNVSFDTGIHVNGTTFFGINGTPYDPASFDTIATQGTIEVWNLTNPTGAIHVFHIHQLDYLVTEVFGQPAPMDGLQDTVVIPAGGWVHVAIPFLEDHTVGKYVFHCHILAHEDKGMMANIWVKKPGE